MTTIVVGTGTNTLMFSIHRVLLCELFDYFDRAYHSGLAESKTGRFEFPGDDPVLWKCIQAWIYTGAIDLERQVRISTLPDSAATSTASSDTTTGPLEACTQTEDLARRYRQRRLIRLYIYAHRLMSTSLQDDCITCLSAETSTIIQVSEINLAFKKTPPESKLCKFLVRAFAIEYTWEGARWYGNHPCTPAQEFFRDFVKVLADIGEGIDDETKFKVCDYHEHPADTECRAANMRLS